MSTPEQAPDRYTSLPRWRRAAAMLALIAAGEAIFFLPFVMARIFRPTLLDVFDITNLELGIAFSIYGLVAMVAYFAGGFLADRYPARLLMTIALGATALGGIVLAGIPALPSLRALYGYWGLTTIFLFWAALIRATRVWGGADRQGSAYGLLDGGRGLFAALMASVGVLIFSAILPVDPATASLDQRATALVRTIWVFTAMTGVAGVLVWLAIPDESDARTARSRGVFSTRVLRMPAVWIQAVIVMCAYVGYKSGDDLGLWTRDTFGYDDVASAQIATLSFWIRPIAALGAGLLADRMRATRVLVLGFSVLGLGSLGIAAGWLQAGMTWMIVATVVVTAIGLHSLRGVYFAVMGEAGVPWALTGSAVGVISLVGYTPDVFMGPLMGFLLDRSPGPAGHQHLFAVVAAFAVLGLLASLSLPAIAARARPVSPPPD